MSLSKILTLLCAIFFCFALNAKANSVYDSPEYHSRFESTSDINLLLKIYKQEAITILLNASKYLRTKNDSTFGIMQKAAEGLAAKEIIWDPKCTGFPATVAAHVDYPGGWNATWIKMTGGDVYDLQYKSLTVCGNFFAKWHFRRFEYNHDFRVGLLVHEGFHLANMQDELLCDYYALRVMFFGRNLDLIKQVGVFSYGGKNQWRPSQRELLEVDSYYANLGGVPVNGNTPSTAPRTTPNQTTETPPRENHSGRDPNPAQNSTQNPGQSDRSKPWTRSNRPSASAPREADRPNNSAPGEAPTNTETPRPASPVPSSSGHACPTLQDLPQLSISSNPINDAEVFRPAMTKTLECVSRKYPANLFLANMLAATKNVRFLPGPYQICQRGGGSAMTKDGNAIEFCSSKYLQNGAYFGLATLLHELTHVMQFRTPFITWKKMPNIQIPPQYRGMHVADECQADRIADSLMKDAWGWNDFFRFPGYFASLGEICPAVERANRTNLEGLLDNAEVYP